MSSSAIENGPWLWQSNSFYSNYSGFYQFCDAVEVSYIYVISEILLIFSRELKLELPSPQTRTVSAWRKLLQATQTGSTLRSSQAIAKAMATQMRESWPALIPTMSQAYSSLISLLATQLTDSGTGCFATSHLTTGKSKLCFLAEDIDANQYTVERLAARRRSSPD
jgi:hypothetical protein